ncbi:MAG: class I adenylate-forming enzyme family protein [Paracoccaceae bacterium]
MTPGGSASGFNLAAHVLTHARTPGNKPALEIISPEAAEVWSHARLRGAVLGAASGFLALGLAPGEAVLLRLGNTPAFPVAFLGAIAAGLVAVPTSPLWTVAELARAAALVAPRLIVADELPAGWPGAAALPRLSADKVLAMERLSPAPFHLGPPERMAYVLFTSGTSSGAPLAVAHAHRAILARAMMHQGWQGLGPEDRLLHAGALNWSFTLGVGLMDPWICGATALVLGPDAQASGAAMLANAAARHGASILAVVPAMFRRLLRTELPPMPRLRHGLSAGEALPPSLRRAWIERTGTDLHEALGMTEVSTFLSGSPARPAPMGAVGFAQPGRRLGLVDEGGQQVGPGQAGQIAVGVEDPGLMLGYLGAPDLTAARRVNGWFLTGDWARQGPDGALISLGRRDDLLNAGGLRASPLEIEEALAGFPGLRECAVTEVPVGPGTTVIGAVLVGEAPLDETALSAHCRTRLASSKIPRIYAQVPALPRGANGKILRSALAGLFGERTPA